MQLNEYYIVDILRLNNEGEGVAKINDKIVFIKNALPLEKVKIKIIEIKKNYARGEIIKLITVSEKRLKSKCPYFNECGGCALMHIPLENQLEFKKEKIENIFKKICKEEIKVSEIKNFNSFNYRNKVVFKVKKDKIGFYKSKSNDIVDVKKCIISDENINHSLKLIRKFIENHKDNKITEIMIRTCDNKVMIALDNIDENLKEEFIHLFDETKVTSIYIGKNLYGIKTLIQTINNLKFNVSKKSFFQINIEVASKIYNEILKYIDNEDVLVDLYSGTGTISLLTANKAKEVIGIEVIKDAILDAKENMILNNIKNVTFKCGKVEKLIDEIKNFKIKTIIMDPPRSGSDKKTLKNIIDLKPKKIIYMSCNPVTLARDYDYLKDYYEIKEIKAFDMFPHTYHVECVCVMGRR